MSKLPLYLQVILSSLPFVCVGALVGWVLRRHMALAAVVASLLSLFISLAFEYIVGRLKLPVSWHDFTASYLHDFVASFILISPLFVLLCWLPALAGVLLATLGAKIRSHV